MDMETKKRRSSNRGEANFQIELALFGFEQLHDTGILFLHQHGEILFANSCFWNLFGREKDETENFVVEQFFAENDASLFKNQLHKSSDESVRLRILTRRRLQGKSNIVVRNARVTCARFNDNWYCCKFQLCDPSLEEELKFYQVADQHLKYPWGFYRLELDKRDVFALFENPLSRSRRESGNLTSFYCRSDGAVSNDEFDWFLQMISKLSETHSIESHVRETVAFGKPFVLKMNFIFIKRDENGYPIILGLMEDITQTNQLQNMLSDKQKTLHELDLANKCLRRFFDIAPLHMGVMKLINNNTDVEYIFANAYHETVLGKSLSGVRGSMKPVSILLTVSAELDTADSVHMWISKYLQAKETQQVVQFQNSYQPHESLMHLHSYAAHIDGDMFAFLSQDITENYLLEQELKKYQSELEEKIKVRTRQLEEALQVKSRFLATMSHEMRTPLSGSMGALSLLEETPLNAEQKNLIRIALVCGEQLLSVINDVLDLSKLEENKMLLDNEPFDIRNTLEESLEMISFEANKKGLELISAIDPSVPQTVIGDSGRVRQIMVNLLSNAVKFSSRGEIVLRAQAKPVESETGAYEITMSVQDEGIGIQEEDKNKLFQVFTQLDNSVTRRHGGTGLGLSICKRFAELMQGKMWFESAIGAGSTFYVSILAHAVPIPEFQPTRMQPLNCAVVDKSMTYARHLCAVLENLGYRTKVLSSAAEATDADCLFMDARLPMEHIGRGAKKKIVVLSCYPAQQTSVPTGYYSLSKPLRESKLKQLLEQIKTHSTASTSNVIHSEEIGNKWNHLSIMIAEDNVMNQQIITRMLAKLTPSPITVVDNGKFAVEQVRRKHFDLILMDMMMPEMGGIEATEIIRKEFGDKPVIVALTANVFTEDQARCIEAGMQEVLMKPVQKGELVRVFEKYFGK